MQVFLVLGRILLRLVIAIAIVTIPLSRRGTFWGRIGGSLAVTVACAVATSSLMPYVMLDFENATSYLARFIVFTTIYLLTVMAVYICWKTRPLTAIFCASVAFSLQNLASTARLEAISLLGRVGIPISDSPASFILTWSIVLLTYVVFYLVFVRDLDMRTLSRYESAEMPLAGAAVILVNVGLDEVTKYLDVAVHAPQACIDFLLVLRMLLCLAIITMGYRLLKNKRRIAEVATLETLIATKEAQYQLSRETIQAVNAHMHDVRHEVATLLTSGDAHVDSGLLRTIIAKISMYDAQTKTGNTAVDTAIMEKRLSCVSMGITLACIADGRVLDFMHASDAYKLLSCVLGPAMHTVLSNGDSELRALTLHLSQRAHLAICHVEGCGELTEDEELTTARAIAEAYDGWLTTSVEDGIFSVNVTIPMP